MRKSSQTLIRVLLGASLLIPLLALATPAQASRTTLIDAEIRSVRLMDSGDVQVEVKYRCDERYGDAPPRISLYFEPDGYAAIWVGDGAICDGTVQTLVAELKRLDGQETPQRFRVYVSIYVADSPSNPYPGGLQGGGWDTYSVKPDRSLSRVADLRVQRTRLNDRGRLVVGMSYECPPGYRVTVEEDWDQALVEVYQDTGEETAWDGDAKTLGYDIVCDGTRNSVVKRFRTTASRRHQDSMDPGLPVTVNAYFYATGPGGASAQDTKTSWPH